MANDIPADIASLSFEESLEQLEEIVRKLEAGQGKLNEAIESYERGAALKRHCEAKLKEAQQKVDRIVTASDGSLRIEPDDED